mmetsp:Transcript_37392/g.81464  ORF Transcript_37392/g.81464 Transcript_37392/m.81464 type:complete len:209 (+) Transcript_37392:1429-2055(+)
MVARISNTLILLRHLICFSVGVHKHIVATMISTISAAVAFRWRFCLHLVLSISSRSVYCRRYLSQFCNGRPNTLPLISAAMIFLTRNKPYRQIRFRFGISRVSIFIMTIIHRFAIKRPGQHLKPKPLNEQLHFITRWLNKSIAMPLDWAYVDPNSSRTKYRTYYSQILVYIRCGINKEACNNCAVLPVVLLRAIGMYEVSYRIRKAPV